MNETEILKKIGELEFVHDQLSMEIVYLDRLLRSVGFPDGINSAREVAEDILRGGELYNEES
jgi:hypothetical protein